jgi:hypothetical protein
MKRKHGEERGAEQEREEPQAKGKGDKKEVQESSRPRTASVASGCSKLDEDEPTPPSSPQHAIVQDVAQEETERPEMAPKLAGVSVNDFFSDLARLESSKESVGTVHAQAKTTYTTSRTLKTAEQTGQWGCAKCGRTNQKNVSQCDCGGLKRLSEWR